MHSTPSVGKARLYRYNVQKVLIILMTLEDMEITHVDSALAVPTKAIDLVESQIIAGRHVRYFTLRVFSRGCD